MGDSMDEELERGGVAMAHGPGPHALSNPNGQGPLGYHHPQQRGPQLSAVAAAAGATDQQQGMRQQQQQQQQQSMAGWARKRERGGKATSSRWTAWEGSPPTPEMSSSSGSGGSDVSINRGIKRMRLNQHQFEQQQQQQQQQQAQQQHLHQGHHPLSAFGSFSSSSAAGGQHHATALHHPGPISLFRAALPNQHAPTHNGINPSAVQKCGSGGALDVGPATAAAAASSVVNPVGQQQRSQSFDSCVAFPPSAPRPPAQARYVRGIRVEANAPSDVDYSDVNHTLRQLHMERRMMAAAQEARQGAAGAAAGGGGGWASGGPAR